jgi:hypothetical protein
MYKILIFLVLGSAISALIAGYQGPEIARPASPCLGLQPDSQGERQEERERKPKHGQAFSNSLVGCRSVSVTC